MPAADVAFGVHLLSRHPAVHVIAVGWRGEIVRDSREEIAPGLTEQGALVVECVAVACAFVHLVITEAGRQPPLRFHVPPDPLRDETRLRTINALVTSALGDPTSLSPAPRQIRSTQ